MTPLFIPSKCKAGFQKRSGTYTGKLSYIIYHDSKTWRKEASWNSWRHKSDNPYDLNVILKQLNENIKNKSRGIYNHDVGGWKGFEKPFSSVEEVKALYPRSYKAYFEDKFTTDIDVSPVEFENVPTSGFVLNKTAGGETRGHSWERREMKCRIYDPRGFEFEITVDNLLLILEVNNSIKGKGLEGEYVYAWQGTELVLLPVDTEEYKKSASASSKILSSSSIKKEECVPGAIFVKKSSTEEFVYLGKHKIFSFNENQLSDKELHCLIRKTNALNLNLGTKSSYHDKEYYSTTVIGLSSLSSYYSVKESFDPDKTLEVLSAFTASPAITGLLKNRPKLLSNKTKPTVIVKGTFRELNEKKAQIYKVVEKATGKRYNAYFHTNIHKQFEIYIIKPGYSSLRLNEEEFAKNYELYLYETF